MIVERDVTYHMYRPQRCRSNKLSHIDIAQKLRGIETLSSAETITHQSMVSSRMIGCWLAVISMILGRPSDTGIEHYHESSGNWPDIGAKRLQVPINQTLIATVSKIDHGDRVSLNYYINISTI
jgi:hypothetical protein